MEQLPRLNFGGLKSQSSSRRRLLLLSKPSSVSQSKRNTNSHAVRHSPNETCEHTCRPSSFACQKEVLKSTKYFRYPQRQPSSKNSSIQRLALASTFKNTRQQSMRLSRSNVGATHRHRRYRQPGRVYKSASS